MSQQIQTAHPTFINLPQPPSHPDTPSEIPGTPTSTTTSLSALSTTAIKDGHRGALHHRGHHHSPSTTSLEAERADRISRLTGLSSVSTLRGPTPTQHNAGSPHSNPTSVPPAAAASLTPAYFDATGQPVAATKVSTVGSASATESVGGRTTSTTEVGGEDRTTLGDDDRDEDMLTEMDSASASGYMGGDGDPDAMDEDLDNLTSQSVDDRMSDDGSASLVGFGEGAGSTLSGPIYHRRPLPSQGSATGSATGVWGPPERAGSGLSEGATAAATPSPHHHQHHGRTRVPEREGGNGTETPVSQSAVRERREARMVDGVALDGAAAAAAADNNDDVFVDTTTRGPVPVVPANARERDRQQRHSHRQPPPMSSPNEPSERVGREKLDDGESRVGVRSSKGTGKGRVPGDLPF